MLMLAVCLLAAGCGDKQVEQSAAPPEPEEPTMQVVRVDGLPDEQEADGRAWQFALSAAYYYNDTDYLLFGTNSSVAGQQAKLFRVAAGAEPEQIRTWPEGGLYDNGEFVNGYYLPASQKLVIYNEAQNNFLIYDNLSGQTMEVAPPVSAELMREDQVFWLGDGRYLFCRFWQDPEELQRVARSVSLYDERTGEEVKLAELGCVWCYLIPPTAQNPERWQLLGSYGELLEIELAADGAKVQQRRCYDAWPTAVSWLHYIMALPVQNAAGDYLVLKVACEDGTHYQVVDLAGGLLSECHADDDKAGGLLAAYGDTIYFSECYLPGSDEPCQIVAYNYTNRNREVIFATRADGLAELYPELHDFEHGAVSPDGGTLLLLDDDYVVSLPLAATENEE